MKKRIYISFLVLIISNFTGFSQKTEISEGLILSDTLVKQESDPLRPARAAFYSAIFPGLGQVYNKKYWKLPIVYGAIGAGIYSYSFNQKKYKEFRNAYKKRLDGTSQPTDNLGFLDDGRLLAGQKFYQKNRDLSLLVTLGLYILNIVDANIDAHLLQYNVNENLSIKPDLQQDALTNKQNLAFTIGYNF
ncbi:MAG: hypothetical protein ACI9XR_001005 [Flavobacterium sp.]